MDAVRDEIVQARRLYERQGWPVIDVTRRSVEETAAAVLNVLHGGHGQVEVLGVSAGIVLASKSAARRAVLDGAGVAYQAATAGVDEDAVKVAMLAEGAGPRDIADALAELKAIKVSRSRSEFVVGGRPDPGIRGRPLRQGRHPARRPRPAAGAARQAAQAPFGGGGWPRTARRSGARW